METLRDIGEQWIKGENNLDIELRVHSLEKFIFEFEQYLKGYDCSEDGYDEIQEIIAKFDEMMWEYVDKPK